MRRSLVVAVLPALALSGAALAANATVAPIESLDTPPGDEAPAGPSRPRRVVREPQE